jgi:formate hydrogenlyase subunit 3/multisubunit Na+/H+ antiporter MnhD subunit
MLMLFAMVTFVAVPYCMHYKNSPTESWYLAQKNF